MHGAGETDETGEEIGGAGFHYYAAAGEYEADFRGRGDDADGGGEGHWSGLGGGSCT